MLITIKKNNDKSLHVENRLQRSVPENVTWLCLGGRCVDYFSGVFLVLDTEPRA